MESQWMEAIQTSGGLHAHGLHADEEMCFYYSSEKEGFMEESGTSRKADVDRAWDRIFAFFRKHLKEI